MDFWSAVQSMKKENPDCQSWTCIEWLTILINSNTPCYLSTNVSGSPKPISLFEILQKVT